MINDPIIPGLGGSSPLVTTGAGGFALQNATPAILSWTAPNDGNLHRVLLIASLNVTVNETGGATQIVVGTSLGSVVFAGGLVIGYTFTQRAAIVQPGTSVVVSQNGALTAGAATFFGELWGS